MILRDAKPIEEHEEQYRSLTAEHTHELELQFGH